MKQCTGERYPGQFQQYSAIDGWHGKFGHLNVLKLDHDDICTHYGQHDRVVTFLPQFDQKLNEIALYVRVDHVWDLGMPNHKQCLDIARKHDNTRGRWEIAKVEETSNSTHLYFTKKKNTKG